MKGQRKKVSIGEIDMFVNDDDEEAWWRAWTIDYIDTEGELAYDDVTGEQVSADEVRKVRKEEMEFVKSIPVYEEAETEECWKETGKGPFTTKWVDHKKADGMRSRWVAGDFKTNPQLIPD